MDGLGAYRVHHQQGPLTATQSEASLASETVSRTTSTLLLVPSVMWFTLFALLPTGIDGAIVGIAVYVPIGASLLTIGYRLRTAGVPDDRSHPSIDPTL